MVRYFLVCLVLMSCGASLPSVDAKAEYTAAVDRLQLNPVYPPRQSLRVGDVYYIRNANPGPQKSNPDNLIYLGHLAEFERYAADYDRSALPIYMKKDRPKTESGQGPFADGMSVMPVAFPSITVSAASAAALGGNLPGGSGLLSFGRSRLVTIGFENTREFGLPKGMAPDRSLYRASLNGMIDRRSDVERCPNVDKELQKDLGLDENSISNSVLIVSRVYITDKIVFTSADARAARAGISASSTGPNTALPAVDLTLSIPENASAAQIEAIMKAASSQTSAQSPVAFGGVSAQGSSVSYSKPINGYVVFAYDGVTDEICPG